MNAEATTAESIERSAIVFAGNLAWVTTSEGLRDFVAGANIPEFIDCEVKRHEDTKRSKGWGLIYFKTAQSARQAIAILGSRELDGRVPHLRLDRSQFEAPAGPEGAGLSNLNMYIGNIAWNVKEEQLMEIFCDSTPLSCNILTNMYGKSRGFALMRFGSADSMQQAITKYNQLELEGRKLELRPDRGPGKADSADGKKTLFVGNLPGEVDEDSLSSLFAEVGFVSSAKIERAADGTSKRWGIVKFENEVAAKAAVDSMKDSPFSIRFDRNK